MLPDLNRMKIFFFFKQNVKTVDELNMYMNAVLFSLFGDFPK